MPSKEFDQYKTYTLREEPFLFIGFPSKINEIVVEESEVGGVCLRVNALRDTNHFWVKDSRLQNAANKIHAAVTLVRDTMFHILAGPSTGVSQILE